MIMELCTGGELFEHLIQTEGKRYSEAIAASYMRTMLSAVAYCHSKGIAHRDLKYVAVCMCSARAPTPPTIARGGRAGADDVLAAGWATLCLRTAAPARR